MSPLTNLLPTRNRRRLRRAAAIGAALLPLAAAGSVQAACLPTATTTAFSKFGDTANYSLLSGANFETGALGWALGSGKIASGSESYAIGSTKDTHSLAVPATARVVSAPFCVGIEHPTFRLFARQASGTWATLLVKLRWTDSTGHVNETTVAALNGASYSAWTPTPAIQLATTLPLWQFGQSITAQIVLDPEDTGGAWQIDDIYIDPVRRS